MFYSVKQMEEAKGKKVKTIGLRLEEDEVSRLDAVVERVKKRNKNMDQTKVLKEIIGFDPRLFVTDEDLLILSGEMPLSGSLPSGLPVNGSQKTAESEAFKASKVGGVPTARAPRKHQKQG